MEKSLKNWLVIINESFDNKEKIFPWKKYITKNISNKESTSMEMIKGEKNFLQMRHLWK